MTHTHLHLVDDAGSNVSPEIKAAVERAYSWVVRDFPQIDPALISNWSEELALRMQARIHSDVAPQRYAYVALRGKVHDWMRKGAAKEEVSGLGRDLEGFSALSVSFESAVDHKILFDQLKSTLNERDRYILVLLLQDNTSPADVAKALRISYAAAAKAIQRVKERIAAALSTSSRVDSGHGSPKLCETKG